MRIYKFLVKLSGTGAVAVLLFPLWAAEPEADPSQPGPATAEELSGPMVTLSGKTQLHLTGMSDLIAGSSFNFTSPDAWLFLDNLPASTVESKFLSRFRVNGTSAVWDANLRVTRYGTGSVLIPYGPDFPAMTVYGDKSCAGPSMPLQCYVKYDGASLSAVKPVIGSFRLKRGYMATLAEGENGTGKSRNYVAQDADVEVDVMPFGLDKGVRFIRIFPWRWTGKKGICGGGGENFNVDWFYNWNINKESSPEVEYVPIRQTRYWPGLKQDWQARGSTELLGFNEPDHKDQSNMTVETAIANWPGLLATGLRVGSPAVSDGGLKWLYKFMDQADSAGLRVDFVAVHYYRAFPNPGDAKGAAAQFYRYLKAIHDRTGRPIWVTEFNNGANWTKDPKPTYEQQRATLAAFIKMLDHTPFVERYAIYNSVGDVRNVQRKDGSLTPAGEVYRDDSAPPAYHP